MTMLSTGKMKLEPKNRNCLAMIKTKTFVRRTINDPAKVRKERLGPTKSIKKANTRYINGG